MSLLRGLRGAEIARGLDLLGQRYGQPPHHWLHLPDVLTAFDWECMTRSIAQEGGE